MKRFVAGADRAQSTLLPESLGDWVDESNSVRVIDAFVYALNIAELGFEGVALHRYWTDACHACPIKAQCTTGRERRITRWEHEEVVEAVQERLDKNPGAMRTRRETVEHPFGTIKMRMGATHFLMKTLPNVATEMALHVLADNLTRVLNIVGVKPIMAAVRA